MPQLTIPKGSKIDSEEGKEIEIRVKNTRFFVLGEQKETKLWNIFLIDKPNNFKEILRENITTKKFALFSNIILKTPFPYIGKRAIDPVGIKKFIKKVTKQTNEPRNNVRVQSSKFQGNRKKRIKSKINLKKINKSSRIRSRNEKHRRLPKSK
jgi:hypothetical protein